MMMCQDIFRPRDPSSDAPAEVEPTFSGYHETHTAIETNNLDIRQDERINSVAENE